VFGAGAEWKIWPNFIVGAEYLHYAFNSSSAIPSNAGGFLDGAPTAAFVGPSGSDHVSLKQRRRDSRSRQLSLQLVGR
jgi:opacity protein-like surface antigen